MAHLLPWTTNSSCLGCVPLCNVTTFAQGSCTATCRVPSIPRGMHGSCYSWRCQTASKRDKLTRPHPKPVCCPAALSRTALCPVGEARSAKAGRWHRRLRGMTAPGLAEHFVPARLGRQLLMGQPGRLCPAIKGGKCFWVCCAKLLSAHWRQRLAGSCSRLPPHCHLMAHYLRSAPNQKRSVNPSFGGGLRELLLLHANVSHESFLPVSLPPSFSQLQAISSHFGPFCFSPFPVLADTPVLSHCSAPPGWEQGAHKADASGSWDGAGRGAVILLSSAGLLPTVPFPGILLQGASLQLPHCLA